MLLSELMVDPSELAARTGWVIKPEGACKGDVCVPLRDDVVANAGRVDVEAFARQLGMPLVRHDDHLWALGPESGTGRALTTAVAPELTLPDADGKPFALSSLRGRKVVMVAWASW